MEDEDVILEGPLIMYEFVDEVIPADGTEVVSPPPPRTIHGAQIDRTKFDELWRLRAEALRLVRETGNVPPELMERITRLVLEMGAASQRDGDDAPAAG
jgi:hypothetical protein